jgi:putative sterol carrier protein
MRAPRQSRDPQEVGVADKYPFLSDPWFDAAEKLITEHDTGAPPGAAVLLNLEVEDGSSKILFHMGSREGKTLFGKGHDESADVTLSTDMETAKSVFIDGNPQAGMQAFMSGKVRVQGDMTKLMMAQAGGGGGNPALTEALQGITE